MEAHKEQQVGPGVLITFYVLIVVLLFTFGDVLTGIVGTLIQSAVFAGYYNSLHKSLD
ncbi:hypothetical protein [Runella sp. SP2]|uniref:hypothetical protein n=1 Tax=Runella sp. SP2 TaxID=2268026 RepID=UPI0013DE487B|nr:hypothetical protein [Runella sp. SP2]